MGVGCEEIPASVNEIFIMGAYSGKMSQDPGHLSTHMYTSDPEMRRKVTLFNSVTYGAHLSFDS